MQKRKLEISEFIQEFDIIKLKALANAMGIGSAWLRVLKNNPEQVKKRHVITLNAVIQSLACQLNEIEIIKPE